MRALSGLSTSAIKQVVNNQSSMKLNYGLNHKAPSNTKG